MDLDEAISLERTGADQDLNPMFGDWQHRFNFAPVPYSAGAAKRTAFRNTIQAELKNKYFYNAEVRLEIVLHLDVQTILETDETADVDNYAKAILDSLKGPDGILLDDTQVQALTISWLDSYGRDRASFEVSIAGSPDDFLLKPVEFYEMPDGLWYPYSRREWNNGGFDEQTDKGYYNTLLLIEMLTSSKKDTRHFFRKNGLDRLGAYRREKYLALPGRGFHRSRIDAGFTMHPRREWRAALEGWRRDHPEEIAETERGLLAMREVRQRMAALLVGQRSERTESKVEARLEKAEAPRDALEPDLGGEVAGE